jgi:RimJ/RimL family protein N-acetyltransferase
VAEVQTGLETLARHQARGDSSVMGVWNRQSGEFLGEVGVYHLDRGAALGEVGYWLRAGAQGHGYATEALGALLGYARSELGVQRFEAHIAADNTPSRRVVERLGFLKAAQRTSAPWWASVDVGAVLIYVLQDTSTHALPSRPD